jgi:hypothetical protein
MVRRRVDAGFGGDIRWALPAVEDKTKSEIITDNAKEKPQEVQAAGSILSLPILGGLHHHYVRI